MDFFQFSFYFKNSLCLVFNFKVNFTVDVRPILDNAKTDQIPAVFIEGKNGARDGSSAAWCAYFR